ncbi:PREDICTED: immunoglobulin omega chain-like [Odobenus rosmarus divergens]
MAWSPVLLELLTAQVGTGPSAVLTQPLPTPASPGTTASLTCTLSRDISVGGSNIYWIQQQPGSPPRDLLYYSSDSDKHEVLGVPGPFSGSKDASANAGLLRISGLQAEAEADCHWATAHGSPPRRTLTPSAPPLTASQRRRK